MQVEGGYIHVLNRLRVRDGTFQTSDLATSVAPGVTRAVVRLQIIAAG